MKYLRLLLCLIPFVGSLVLIAWNDKMLKSVWGKPDRDGFLMRVQIPLGRTGLFLLFWSVMFAMGAIIVWQLYINGIVLVNLAFDIILFATLLLSLPAIIYTIHAQKIIDKQNKIDFESLRPIPNYWEKVTKRLEQEKETKSLSPLETEIEQTQENNLEKTDE